MKLKTILSLYEKGKRKNQEDFILNYKNKLFIICDGVGGQKYGELASKLASEEFAKNINNLKLLQKNELYAKSFENTQDAFDKHIAKYPETKEMATTMVALHFNEKNIAIMHCGDSRFYNIREGKILWQTEDHTIINELIKAGVL